MSDCSNLPVLEPGARACAACGQRGRIVQLRTVKALLTEVALGRVQLTHYRFCANTACKVVYFGDAGDHFDTSDLRVPVWHKKPEGACLLCYCFGDTESAIRSELIERGRTQVVERIRAHIEAQRCACDVRNPSGVCCLGDVIAVVKRLEESLLDGKETDGAGPNISHR